MAAFVFAAGCDRFVGLETRLERARASLDTHAYQAALIDVRKALDSEPDNIAALLLHVDVLAASGEVESAVLQLDRAQAAGATAADLEPRRIDLLIAQGDLDGAGTALEASATLPPAHRAAYDGRLRLLRQQPAEAEAAFDRALAADPAYVPAILGRAEALAAQGRIEQAQRALAGLLERDPASGQAWLLSGGLQAQAGSYEAAAEAFGAAVTRGRGLTRFQLLRAHAARVSAHLAGGQLDRAREALAALEKDAGDAVLVSLMRARVALAAGDVSTAVNELRVYTRAMPQEITGRLLLTGALLEQGNIEQAYAQAVRTAADFPGEDGPQLALAEIQLRLGRTADAERTLTALATRPQPNPQALATLGRLRIQQGESLAGIDYIRRSLTERPDDSQLQLQLAAAYVAAGEPRRAAEVLQAIPEGDAAASRDRLRVIITAALEGPAEAERQLDQALARYPRDVDLLRLAAAHYGGAGNLDRARRYVEQALEVRPDDVSLKLGLARLEVAGARLDEAEQVARTILELSPSDIPAMLLMTEIESRRGRDAEVEGWLERARAADPKALEPRFVLVRRALSRGDSARAQELLSEAAGAAQNDAAALLKLGELSAAAGRNADAMTHLRRAASLDPGSPVILLAMARVELAEGRIAAARQSLRRATELAPDWLPPSRTLVALETREGNLAAALDVARRLREKDPNGAASHLLEGDAYLGAGRAADAAAAYRVAYLRSPSAVAASRSAQARSAAGLANPTAELQDWLRRNPNDASSRRTLADYLIAAGQRDAAIAELERVVEARPEDPVALNNLAWLYGERGDHPRAVPLARRAAELAPDSGSIADTYGWLMVGAGQVEEGVAALRRAVELSPKDGQAQYHLAFGLDKAGRRDEALNVLRPLVASGAEFASRAEAERLLAALHGRQ
jgi:putative PEP-CTERM system TPR-repeat lipoprotein